MKSVTRENWLDVADTDLECGVVGVHMHKQHLVPRGQVVPDRLAGAAGGQRWSASWTPAPVEVPSTAMS